MISRRHFARTVVGAIVGASAIPEFGKKPALNLLAKETRVPWSCISLYDPSGKLVDRIESGTRPAKELMEEMSRKFDASKDFMFEDISIAKKIHLKEQWGA